MPATNDKHLTDTKAVVSRRVTYQNAIFKQRQNRQLRLALVFLAIPLVCFCLSLIYRPYAPDQMALADRFARPTFNHWFGTDNYGRDIFTRVMSGLPLTLFISLAINFIGCSLGLLMGGLAGYLAGPVDYVFSRIFDALLAIPAILMGMLFVASFGNGVWQLVLALGIMFIPSYGRIVRSSFLEYRGKNFVKRLKLLGLSSSKIIFCQIFPLITDRLLSALALGFANAILAESSLSFLGLGVPPDQITWGHMLKDAQGYVFQNPSAAIFPGLMIVLLVLGSFLLGQAFKVRAERGSSL